MAQKTLEILYEEVKQLFIDREVRFLNRILSLDNTASTPEEIADQEEKDKEEEKYIRSIKSRIRYISSLINDKEKEKKQKDRDNGRGDDNNGNLMGKIKHMKSTVGDIVISIPKDKIG